jgi:hypothetical protein
MTFSARKSQYVNTFFKRLKMLYILVAALRQTDFPTAPASVSVLDLNYLYLHADAPSATRRKM